MKKEALIYVFSVFAFCFIILYSLLSRTFYYIPDSIASIIVVSTLYLLYKKLNLNKTIFILISLSMMLHDLGIFGFYSTSPFPFAYDKLTHFTGGLSLSIFFTNFIRQFFTKSFINNFLSVIFAVLCTLGIGSVIEITEYIGFLFLGQGEGFLYFGGTGDLTGNYNLGGAWINSSIDMIYNLLGSILGVILYFIVIRLGLNNTPE